jgi:beta-lactamase regulating signal transducer with metallopeptidase domain
VSPLLHEWAAAWSGWALPRALQFTAVAALLLPLDRLLAKRAWPRLRLALLSVALLGLALPAAPAGIVSKLAVAPLVQADAATIVGSTAGAETTGTGAAAGPTLLVVAFVAWIAGALLFAIGALVHHRRVRARLLAADLGASASLRERVERLVRRLGLRRAPRIVVAEALRSPALLGCARPLLLLPASLAERELDHALLHELSHLKRRDPWSAAASFGVVALWWFHPLAWFAARRCAALRELCCDDDVARLLGSDAAAYRATLLAHGRRLLGADGRRRIDRPRLAGPIGFFAAPSLLVARLEQLSRLRVRRPRLERGATFAAAALVAAVAWPAVAADRGRAAPPITIDPDAALRDEESALRAEALAVVRASNGPSRPPGCLRFHHAVLFLQSLEERTSP